MKSETRIKNEEVGFSLKEITNRVQNGGSMKSINDQVVREREEKYFISSFPSINQMDLEMRIDDFPEGQENRYSRVVLGSMAKIEEEWNDR